MRTAATWLRSVSGRESDMRTTPDLPSERRSLISIVSLSLKLNMRTGVLILTIFVGAALFCARLSFPSGALAIHILGNTNLSNGQPATMQLSNTCSYQIQLVGCTLEERTKGDSTSTLAQLGAQNALKPHEAKLVQVLPRGKGKEWRFTYQYYTLSTKRHVQEKLANLGFSRRLLRKVFNDASTSEWVSEE